MSKLVQLSVPFTIQARLRCLGLLCALSPSFIANANAALSATTTYTIVGSAPYLQWMEEDNTLSSVLVDLDELLSIKIPDGESGMEQISTDNPLINAPEGMAFSDITALIPVDGLSYNIADIENLIVVDNEGDSSDNQGIALGSMSATWYDDDVKISNLNRQLTPCGGPYTLTIKADAVAASTRYGDPNSLLYGNREVTYTFMTNGMQICYAQPGSMQIYTTNGAAGVNSQFPTTGYNPAVWESDKGFSIPRMKQAGVSFPTTGFNGATFSLIGSGSDQSNFYCTSNSNLITLSAQAATTTLGKGCKISYNTETKFTTPIVIEMRYQGNNRNGEIVIGNYTIFPPKLWATLKGYQHYTNSKYGFVQSDFYPAASMCKDNSTKSVTTLSEAAQYFFTRKELTNVPSANKEISAWTINSLERFARDADGTFTGEWGSLYSDYGYTGFNFIKNGWVAEGDATPTLTRQFSVNIEHGYVDYTVIYSASNKGQLVLCRG